MLLSSTSTLENKTIVKYHGLVNGESLIGSNIYKDLFSGVRDVVEGRTTAYAEELDSARNEAIKTMESKAKELDANGIIGLKISYNVKYLPYFMEWKSTGSGDYVVGLEPANSSVFGRTYHETQNSVHKLAPFAKETNVLKFTVLDGEEEINAAVAAFENKF